MQKKSSQILIRKYKTAGSFFDRLAGLMFRKTMPEYGVLFFPGCSSIHTFFMRFNLDIIMTDKNFVVMDFAEALKPFRFFITAGAKHTFEAPDGFIKKNRIKKGVTIHIHEKTK